MVNIESKCILRTFSVTKYFKFLLWSRTQLHYALLQPTVWILLVGFLTTLALFELTLVRTGQPDWSTPIWTVRTTQHQSDHPSMAGSNWPETDLFSAALMHCICKWTPALSPSHCSLMKKRKVIYKNITHPILSKTLLCTNWCLLPSYLLIILGNVYLTRTFFIHSFPLLPMDLTNHHWNACSQR